MKLVSAAAYTSRRRGYDYAKSGKVLSFNQLSENVFNGLVQGKRNEAYSVHIDLNHVRQSRCDCPYTQGNRKICKHMVALYFTVHPSDLIQFEVDVIEAEERYDAYLSIREDRFSKFIDQLEKEDLKNMLVQLLEFGPDWQYDNFYREYIDVDDDSNDEEDDYY